MSDERPWLYERGMPDRSGMAEFTHLIRGPYDEPETMEHGAGKRDPMHWRKNEKNVEAWCWAIIQLLEDGEARTFNGICIALTGTTADVWFTTAPDQALWMLVELQALAWTCQRYLVKKTKHKEEHTTGCVLFTLSRFVDWG